MKSKDKCITKYCRKPKAAGHFCHSCIKKKYAAKHPLRYCFSILKNNAKRRGKQFDISMEEFKKFCEDNGYMEGKGKTAGSLSIERIRAYEGYTASNIQILTLEENGRKGQIEGVPF